MIITVEECESKMDVVAGTKATSVLPLSLVVWTLLDLVSTAYGLMGLQIDYHT